MLILTRKRGESILIGDDTKVTVISIDGAHVRLGIDCPRSIAVDREEIRKKKDAGPLNGNA